MNKHKLISKVAIYFYFIFPLFFGVELFNREDTSSQTILQGLEPRQQHPAIDRPWLLKVRTRLLRSKSARGREPQTVPHSDWR